MRAAVYSEPRLQQVIGDLRRDFKATGYLRLSWSAEKDRSNKQNGLSHIWYEQVSSELGEHTPAQAKCFCKLHYGVPIMRRDDEDFKQLYDATIKPMPYETKLKAIGLIPVTSLMNVSQLSEYLTEMKEAYAGRVDLQFPDDGGRWP